MTRIERIFTAKLKKESVLIILIRPIRVPKNYLQAHDNCIDRVGRVHFLPANNSNVF